MQLSSSGEVVTFNRTPSPSVHCSLDEYPLVGERERAADVLATVTKERIEKFRQTALIQYKPAAYQRISSLSSFVPPFVCCLCSFGRLVSKARSSDVRHISRYNFWRRQRPCHRGRRQSRRGLARRSAAPSPTAWRAPGLWDSD